MIYHISQNHILSLHQTISELPTIYIPTLMRIIVLGTELPEAFPQESVLPYRSIHLSFKHCLSCLTAHAFTSYPIISSNSLYRWRLPYCNVVLHVGKSSASQSKHTNEVSMFYVSAFNCSHPPKTSSLSPRIVLCRSRVLSSSMSYLAICRYE